MNLRYAQTEDPEGLHSTSFRNSTCTRWTSGEEKPPEAATDGTTKHLLKDVGPADANSDQWNRECEKGDARHPSSKVTSA